MSAPFDPAAWIAEFEVEGGRAWVQDLGDGRRALGWLLARTPRGFALEEEIGVDAARRRAVADWIEARS